MEDLIINTLEKLGHPVMRQGSMMPEEKYPEDFFTFWNDDSSSDSHYDNRHSAVIWEYSINFYSTDPQETYAKLSEATELLRAAGFVIDGEGYDVGSDEPTHTGRGISIIYRQNK